MASSKARYNWLVGHTRGEFPHVWVGADNWEQATVEAARVWDVPWGKVAAYCVEEQKKPALRNVCAKCGRFFNGAGDLCDQCIDVQKAEAQRTDYYRRKYYRRHAGGGERRGQ